MLQEKIRSLATQPGAHETCHWLNSLIANIFSSGIGSDSPNQPHFRKKLLVYLAELVKDALSSKLQNYQQESWLFLQSLSLNAFDVGERLPSITRIKPFTRANQSVFAFIFDIDYKGGFYANLHAAMAMNIRDMNVAVKAAPFSTKLVVKIETQPTLRLSLLLSELPKYDVKVHMRDAHLLRVSKLFKEMVNSMVIPRCIYPNYLTLLFTNDEPRSVVIATEQQFQTQLRLRILSVLLDLENPLILAPGPDTTADDIRIQCCVSCGESVSWTDPVHLSQARWNHIHSFTIFNGLPSSPTEISIKIYQFMESGANLLDQVVIPYRSIPAGVLDVRSVSFAHDAASSITAEIYLHNIEEKGGEDGSWIFWNEAKPSGLRRSGTAQAMDQMSNWQTIKYVISALTGPEEYPSDAAEEVIGEEREAAPAAVVDGLHAEDASSAVPNLLEFAKERVDEATQLVQFTLLPALNRQQDAGANVQGAQQQARNLRATLAVFRLELEEFSAGHEDFALEGFLSDLTLHAHHSRQAGLLRPLVKSFLPPVLACMPELERREELAQPVAAVAHALHALQDQVLQHCARASSAASLSPLSTSHAGPITGSFSADALSTASQVAFNCWLGREPFRIVATVADGIQISHVRAQDTHVFETEAIFYALRRDLGRTQLKTLDVGALDLSAGNALLAACWEVTLVGDAVLALVPFGCSHLFPARLVALADIAEACLVKNRGAFALGAQGRADASSGLLRVRLAAQAEWLDLHGDARSCDVWYALISSHIARALGPVAVPWRCVERIWLLPVHAPVFPLHYALALTLNGSTHVVSALEPGTDLHAVYCDLKSLAARAQGRPSLLSSPASSRSCVSLGASAASLSVGSAARADWCSDPRRFDRISCARPSPVQSASSSSHSLLVMNSIDRLLLRAPSHSSSSSSLLQTPVGLPTWVTALLQASGADAEALAETFECALNGTPGCLLVSTDYLCFWGTGHAPALALLPVPQIRAVQRQRAWLPGRDALHLRMASATVVLAGYQSHEMLEICERCISTRLH